MSPTASVVRAAHASGVHAVERSLNALHGEMLRSAADDAGHVRLFVLNLVAACIEHEDARVATEVLTAIGARHPARAIVIHAHPEDERVSIEADVSLQRASVAGHEVYTELMLLTISGEPAFHLSSIVTPLLIPDIPTDLWVVGAPRLVQAFSDEVIAMTDRIILDSGAYPDPVETLRLLTQELGRHDGRLVIGDFAWERTRAWRQLVAQAFGAPGQGRRLDAVRSISVESWGDHSPAQAWLLAGWLVSRLGWSEPRGRLTMRAEGGGDVASLRSVRIELEGDEPGSVSVEATGSALCVTSDLGGVSLSRVVEHEQPDVLALMSRLLDETRVDALYPAAVAGAVSLA